MHPRRRSPYVLTALAVALQGCGSSGAAWAPTRHARRAEPPPPAWDRGAEAQGESFRPAPQPAPVGDLAWQPAGPAPRVPVSPPPPRWQPPRAEEPAPPPPPPVTPAWTDGAEDRRSTFALDVDTASYSLARAHLQAGRLPPAGGVRVEEFVNAFRQDLAAPRGGDAFAVHVEGAPAPFGPTGAWLVRVGLQARRVPSSLRKDAALVFCVDTSGSMADEGRLDMVKDSLRTLVRALRRTDQVAIVAFSTTARVVLGPTFASEADDVLDAIDELEPDGSTNVEQGLLEAYALAVQARWPHGRDRPADRTVRVVLCTDGIANTGRTRAAAILARVREHVDQGVQLTAVGVGVQGYNDALLEQLALAGDGHYRYLDRREEAQRYFRDELVGTLEAVAMDARVQVEVDPRVVRRWRLLGYEDRAMADRDFRNDGKDAGEVGAGHAVVALYELELEDEAPRDGRICVVRARWRDPDDHDVRELAQALERADLARTAEDLSPRFLVCAVAAELARALRGEGQVDFGSLRAASRWAARALGDPQVGELALLVDRAGWLLDAERAPVRGWRGE